MAAFELAELPSVAVAWEQVLDFCRQRRDDQVPILTLEKGIANRIVSVEDDLIKRVSEGSPEGKNTAHIRRSEFDKVWKHLLEHRWTKADPHVFLLALLCAALPELVKFIGEKTIVAREHCVLVAGAGDGSQRRDAPGFKWPKYAFRDYGEGFDHWVIKNYIYDHPGAALAALPGGPWDKSERRLEVEFPIPTKDRVDLVVFDQSNVPLMIEVKPSVASVNIGYYAQAAKYRAIWQVLFETAVRCVIAAPKIPNVLGAQMLALHGIESVEVDVPSEYRDRKRPIFDAHPTE